MVYRLIFGVFAMALGALFALGGFIRLGIGRHGAARWKPFTNAWTAAHVENLASLALGVTGMMLGAWLVVAAIRQR